MVKGEQQMAGSNIDFEAAQAILDAFEELNGATLVPTLCMCEDTVAAMLGISTSELIKTIHPLTEEVNEGLGPIVLRKEC